MTRPIPPQEPLDEQERELARVVRALPGGEPPASLDARILKAAANAAAASRQPRARWLASAGALWGIGGAAAAVLALGVSWQMMYPTPRSSPSAPAAAMADQAEDSAISVEFKDRAASPLEHSAAPPPSVAAGEPSAPPARARAPAPPPMPSPEPFAGEPLDEHVATSAEAEASADVMATAAQATSARQEGGAATAKAAAAEARARPVAPSPPASLATPSAPGVLGDSAEPARMKPATWLAHIRRLRDDDRPAEARASLLEFRERYPNFVIPSDLAPLLRE